MQSFAALSHDEQAKRLPRWDADGLFTEASSYKPGSLVAIFSPADRADFLLAEVVCRDNDHLLSFLTEKLYKVQGVQQAETFMYLRVCKDRGVD